MNLALLSNPFHPQVNGVACTLKRLTQYLEKNDVPHKVIMPSIEVPLMN
jgi:hypothetical protein